MRAHELLWGLPSDVPLSVLDMGDGLDVLSPPPMNVDLLVDERDLAVRVDKLLLLLPKGPAPTLSAAQALGLTPGLPALIMPFMRRCGPGITAIASATFYRTCITGLTGTGGLYQAAVGAGVGRYGQSGFGDSLDLKITLL